MKYSAYRIQANDYSIRTTLHQDHQTIIVPVVMMVEGVHNGSAGRLFHSSEELSKCLSAWDGIPISVQHPTGVDGNFISANQPGVIDSQLIGRVYQTSFDNGRLRAEAWLDETRLKQISPEMYASIQSRRPIEVSVGVFTDDEEIEGEWQGESYVGVARNHKPDHLALLLDAVGACSIEDGCGVGANEEGGEEGVKEYTRFIICEEGFRGRIDKIQSKLDGMDDDLKLHYLQEVFQSHFIYEVQSKGGGSAGNLFRRNYQVNSDGAVEFTGEPTAVIKKVEYVTQADGKTDEPSDTKGGGKVMQRGDTKKECPECPEIVKALIANELTNYTEEDSDMLLALGADLGHEHLSKMLPKEGVELKVNKEKKEEPKEDTLITMEEALKVITANKEKASPDPEEFYKLIPKELADQFKSGLALHQASRADLISRIVANQKGKSFTEANLKDTSMEELTRLAEAIGTPITYVGAHGGAPEHRGSDLPPVIVPAVYAKHAKTDKKE